MKQYFNSPSGMSLTWDIHCILTGILGLIFKALFGEDNIVFTNKSNKAGIRK